MNEKTSKGPWVVYDDYTSTGRIEIVAFGKSIARIYLTKGDEQEDFANAHLIAAAPELYEACIAAVDRLALLGRDHQDVCRILASAIDKARGEQPS